MAKSKRCKKKSGFGKIIKGLSSFGKDGRSKRLQTLFVSPIRTK
jgi:hypothetical protein